MMLRLLDAVDGIAVLGGNYWAEDLEKEAQTLNALTQRLWNQKSPCSPQEKEEIIRKIQGLELPARYKLVVHKRSFPFLDMDHFPHIVDCFRFSADVRILNMRRDHAANTRSILRREFETDRERAAKRTDAAVERLSKELVGLEPGCVLNIDYEDIIDTEKKNNLLEEIACHIGLEPEDLSRFSHVITGPTRSNQLID